MGTTVDGVLIAWGERLFYPANRSVRADPARLAGGAARRAAAIRQRIQATVSRRSVQVMVKVTGGGRGMAAIAAHFRYISKAGRLDIEDDRGELRRGPEALRDLTEQWRLGGMPIDEVGHRREAFNIMLSMPRGTDAQVVRLAARDFAREELLGHRYVMVLHDHQANPHVHLSVKASSMLGDRLNPRKADLHRWRETFAEKLRGYGIEAEATRQATRGVLRNVDPLWRLKAKEQGRLGQGKPESKSGQPAMLSRKEAVQAWLKIMQALDASEMPEDRALAADVGRFLTRLPVLQPFVKAQEQARQGATPTRPDRTPQVAKPPQPDIARQRERPRQQDITPQRPGPDFKR